MAVQDYFLICGPGGCTAPDGTQQPAGTAVGHILYDPADEYTPPDGLVLTPAAGFAGTIYQPASLPPPVPVSVSRWQLRAVLMGQPSTKGLASLCADADALAAQVGGLVENAWTNADTIQRSSPNLNALAQQLGITEPQIDAMFLAAAAVTA